MKHFYFIFLNVFKYNFTKLRKPKHKQTYPLSLAESDVLWISKNLLCSWVYFLFFRLLPPFFGKEKNQQLGIYAGGTRRIACMYHDFVKLLLYGNF